VDGWFYYTGSAFVCRSIPSVTLSNPSRRFTEYVAPPDGFKNAPLVFVGYGVAAPERQWDDFKGLDLKGKLAVVLINDPDFETGERSERPKQTVRYTAHGDHLGIGTPDATGDTIYNGAVDNGTGLAAVLELARAYGKQPAPKRSVVFLVVTAEEKGLLGSEYYAFNCCTPSAAD
jgi:Zn-dependent M28 family amino/carboxypeptidase